MVLTTMFDTWERGFLYKLFIYKANNCIDAVKRAK